MTAWPAQINNSVELVWFLCPTRHVTGHFGIEYFQAIGYTGTDNWNKETNSTCNTKKIKANTENMPQLRHTQNYKTTV